MSRANFSECGCVWFTQWRSSQMSNSAHARGRCTELKARIKLKVELKASKYKKNAHRDEMPRKPYSFVLFVEGFFLEEFGGIWRETAIFLYWRCNVWWKIFPWRKVHKEQCSGLGPTSFLLENFCNKTSVQTASWASYPMLFCLGFALRRSQRSTAAPSTAQTPEDLGHHNVPRTYLGVSPLTRSPARVHWWHGYGQVMENNDCVLHRSDSLVQIPTRWHTAYSTGPAVGMEDEV